MLRRNEGAGSNGNIMLIITGGQTGVDRAALDAALESGIGYAGWCPLGGWAEDKPEPPGVRADYPLLRETPLLDPEQRTEWNVRDADAVLIIVDSGGLATSKGTMFASALAGKYGKPSLVINLSKSAAASCAARWLAELGPDVVLGIGGPRESEAPGIYSNAKRFLRLLFDQRRASDAVVM